MSGGSLRDYREGEGKEVLFALLNDSTVQEWTRHNRTKKSAVHSLRTYCLLAQYRRKLSPPPLDLAPLLPSHQIRSHIICYMVRRMPYEGFYCNHFNLFELFESHREEKTRFWNSMHQYDCRIPEHVDESQSVGVQLTGKILPGWHMLPLSVCVCGLLGKAMVLLTIKFSEIDCRYHFQCSETAYYSVRKES